jgi:hypothetical protein
MAGEGLPVEVACRVLGVSCASFYAWRFRPPSARAVRHAWLTDLIREVHAASCGSYGANRVHAELVLGAGIRVAKPEDQVAFPSSPHPLTEHAATRLTAGFRGHGEPLT